MAGGTAGISLYRDHLYGNLYVMPIYDIQNHVINVGSFTKCDQNMSNMASCIGKFSILWMKNADMLLFTTNIYECSLYAGT